MTEPDQESPVATDPDAPFGRRPNGTPYKRDPAAFAHLRGRPFGSMNGAASDPAAPKRRTFGGSGKPKATASTAPLKHDAAGYAAKFARGFRTAGKAILRRNPPAGAIVLVRSEDMAAAWGQVAVSYPKVGRWVDRISKGGDLSEAVGSTMTTLVMMAHVSGYTTAVPWVADMIEEAVDETMTRFVAMAEADGTLRRRYEEGTAAREAKARAQADATVSGEVVVVTSGDVRGGVPDAA